MKKLYNKALMYQYFYMGKWALLLSCFFLGFICYESINNNLSVLKNNISSLNGNEYMVFNYDIRLISWGLLLLLYVIITGINKRNNMSFLTSGPYTKSEIKKNEILFLLISLCAFIVVFCYISICIYYREMDLISLSCNFGRETFKEIVKIFISGLAFISYLSIMDSLFANIGITVFLMLSTPFIVFFDIMFLQSAVEGLSCTIIYKNKISRFMFNTIDNAVTFILGNINYNEYNTYYIISVILVATIILFILTSYTVKKLTINNTNKLFNFPIVEKIFIWCFSISISLLGGCIAVNSYYHRSGSYYSEEATFSLQGIAYILIIIAISYIIKRITSKQLKKII